MSTITVTSICLQHLEDTWRDSSTTGNMVSHSIPNCRIKCHWSLVFCTNVFADLGTKYRIFLFEPYPARLCAIARYNLPLYQSHCMWYDVVRWTTLCNNMSRLQIEQIMVIAYDLSAYVLWFDWFMRKTLLNLYRVITDHVRWRVLWWL